MKKPPKRLNFWIGIFEALAELRAGEHMTLANAMIRDKKHTKTHPNVMLDVENTKRVLTSSPIMLSIVDVSEPMLKHVLFAVVKDVSSFNWRCFE